MQKSKARKQLEKLLSEATDTATKADLASRLAKVIDVEGRERGRKRRAQKAKPEKPAPPRDDSNDPFFICDFCTSTSPNGHEECVKKAEEYARAARELEAKAKLKEMPEEPQEIDYAAEIIAAEARKPKCPASGLANGWSHTFESMPAHYVHDEEGNTYVFNGEVGAYVKVLPEFAMANVIDGVPRNDVLSSDTFSDGQFESERQANEAAKKAADDRAFAEQLEKFHTSRIK